MILSSFESEAPEWSRLPCLLGIDEAGRGPVLGPMVYGTAFCPLSQKDHLTTMAFADSKTLTEDKRDGLFSIIKDCPFMGWAADVISPQSLSAQMLSLERRSLNVISYDSAMGLIQLAIDAGVLLKEVYVDTVGDPEKYEARLTEKFHGIQFSVRKKADSLFPIVSAASIVAKVIRDRELREWENIGNHPFENSFGSGYPADPETKAWLVAHREEVFGFPDLVRFSWSTCRNLLDESCVSVVWDCEEEEELGNSGNKRKKLTKVEFQSSAPSRHSFFRTRQLQNITKKL